MNSGSEDEAADRALNGVARKLDKSLSVEYTVNELISGAMDVVNLAKMYYGELCVRCVEVLVLTKECVGWSPYA